jgi:peptidoglycan/xylan/chitin deacetylase (PgdA/CDA1 family)
MTKRIVNVCFHGVGVPDRELEPGEHDYWISPEFFREVLDEIQGRPDVRVSFDDGNASDVEIALAELQHRNLTASFFPIAARIGKAGSVDRTGLRALAGSGMIIGSHGMWHKPWRGMTPQQLDEELVAARRIIAEASGVEVDTAACPLGSYDRKVLTLLRRLGYATVFTSDRSRSPQNAWLQARFSVRKSDDLGAVLGVLEREPSVRSQLIQTARITAKRWR